MIKKENNAKDILIAGTDEVGRGCLAGPVVGCAVILPPGYRNSEIKDSKQLTAKQREKLAKVIKEVALAYSIIFVRKATIEKINIKNASKLAMTKAINTLKYKPQLVLVDYEVLALDIAQRNIIKGDQKSVIIASASILAKVARDCYMQKLHQHFPQYNWAKNKGYGTSEHVKALKIFGITKHHRRNFKPVKDLIKG